MKESCIELTAPHDVAVVTIENIAEGDNPEPHLFALHVTSWLENPGSLVDTKRGECGISRRASDQMAIPAAAGR